MNKFWDKIREHNANLLAAQIKTNGGICNADAEDILKNLKYLAEKGESFGEETRFIRLDVRRALGSLCDTGKLVFKIEPESIRWSDDGDSVTLGGYLYEARPDGTMIIVSGFACGGAARADVYAREDLTNAQRTASMLGLASARAESNAYYNAGIGIEFKGGDVFDLEALEKQIPEVEPTMPTPVSQEERKAKRGRPKKEKTVEESNPDNSASTKPVEDPKPEGSALPKPVEEHKPAEPAAADKSEVKDAPTGGEMTYDMAMEITVDCGVYKDKKIGEILAAPQTARNIVWVYKQNTEGRTPETKQALSLAIEGYNNGALKRFL